MIFLFLYLCLSYDEPTVVTLFKPGDEGSKYYRIPSIVCAPNGSLITATDKRINNDGDLPNNIDVVVKTSHDGGLTWGPTKVIASGNPKGYGDASLVVDRETGNVLLLFNGDNGFYQSTSTNPQRIYVSISKDNGETWSEPRDITYMLYGFECENLERNSWEGMFLTSGAALQIRSGRIMVVGCVRKKDVSGVFNYVVYTDDGGENWDVGISPGCSVIALEAKVVELNNGDILMNIRQKPYRYESISHDKGLTFGDVVARPDLVDPSCNGEIIRYTSTRDGYDKDRLIFVNDHHPSQRKNTSIKISYDEGKTWPVSKVIHAGDAWYPAVTITSDGTIAVYFERAENNAAYMDVVLMSLEWVTDGADKYTPPNPEKAKSWKARHRRH